MLTPDKKMRVMCTGYIYTNQHKLILRWAGLQEKGQSQTIAANFSKQLANAFEEEKLWRAQGFSISNTVRQLQADGERLRLLRAQVWSLTSLFNQVSLGCPALMTIHIPAITLAYFNGPIGT